MSASGPRPHPHSGLPGIVSGMGDHTYLVIIALMTPWLCRGKNVYSREHADLCLEFDTDSSTVARPLPLSDRPTFTFIDHDEDLASKQIRGASARKTIRSHVMRDVRRRERLEGRKRPSKRGKRSPTDSTKPTGSASSSKKATPKGTTSSPGESQNEGLEGALVAVDPAYTFSPSPLSSPSSSQPSIDLDLTYKLGRKGLCSWPGDLYISKEKIRELSSQLFDPFVCLPGTDDLPFMIEALVRYCE